MIPGWTVFNCYISKNKTAGRNTPQSRSRIPARNSREGTDDSGIGSIPSTPSEPTAAQTAAPVSQVIEYREVVSVLDILRTKDATITKLKRDLIRAENGKAEVLNDSKQLKRDLELRILRLDLEKEEFKVQDKELRQRNFIQEEKIDRITEQLRQERAKNSKLKLEAAKIARLTGNLAGQKNTDKNHSQDIIGLNKENDELTANLRPWRKSLTNVKQMFVRERMSWIVC